jgi:hypothetical protein
MKNVPSRWILLAALAVGVGIISYNNNTHGGRFRTAATASAKSQAHDVNSIAGSSLFSPVSKAHAFVPVPNQEILPKPASDAIRAVLPSVPYQIDNWRNYRPDIYIIRRTPESPDITFHVEKIKDEGRFTTWIGRSVIAGESFVAVATAEGLDAIATIAGEAPVEIHLRQDRVAITHPTDELGTIGCGAEPNQFASLIEPGATVAAALVQDNSNNYLAGVVVLYDNLALAQANSSALDGNGALLIDSTMKARVESSNLILVNSLINVRWAYLGCFQCPEHGDTPLETLWGMVSNPSNDLGAFAVRKATETGATHVIVYSKPTDPQWGGYGNIFGHYSVVRYGMSYTVFAHELGHNFGLNHDRFTKGALSASYDGNYSYGMVFSVRNTTTTDPAVNPIEQMGDIMSYSKRLVPYFTSASLTINQYLAATRWTPLANGNIYIGALETYADPSNIVYLANAASTQPLGIPAGQPYACDGARTFRENAAAIINGGWGVQPAITSQPTNVTATVGQSFSLNVTAVGTGATFAYQWYKGATAVSGATSAKYTVENSAIADSGTYHVEVIANIAALGGTALLTSNSATVTVNPPTISGGSDGGGGALSPISVAALLTLLFIASSSQNKRRLT